MKQTPLAFALIGLLLASAPAAAQIILPGQTGQDLPHVPTWKPSPLPGVDPSWTLRHGKRPPPPRWERENGFAQPPAFGGPRDAKPRSPYLE
ncbi:MAG: hypothetical protein ACRC7G_00700 [Beijerinckiaceae bacterium]